MIEPPSRQAVADNRLALWNLGFRPFYLLAAAFSALAVLLWAAAFSGLLPFLHAKTAAEHAQEMLFGYTTAVIAGFLLTAVRNWTGLPTPSGAPLMGLAGLWLLGRLLFLTPYSLAAATANALFPLAVALGIGLPIWRARNSRNYFFIGLLALMSALSIVAALSRSGRLELPPVFSLQLFLDVVLFIMAVVAGRVVPMFTNNGIPGATATRHPLVEKAALGSLLALFLADLLLPAPFVAVVASAAALTHALRLALWKPWQTRSTPLVWVLHAAYAWIVVHLALRSGAALDLLPASAAIHALTVGAIGGLTLGMMTRTARGHTGRPLQAGAGEVAMYVLVNAAGLTRLCAGFAAGETYLNCIRASAVLWAAAFALYVVCYWPVLMRPRLDGKPG